MLEQKYIPIVDIIDDVTTPLCEENGLVRWMVQSFTRKAFYFNGDCIIEDAGSPDAQTIANLLKTSEFCNKIFIVNTPTFEYKDKTVNVTTLIYNSVLDLISDFNNILKEGYLLFLYQNKISGAGHNFIRFAKFKQENN